MINHTEVYEFFNEKDNLLTNKNKKISSLQSDDYDTIPISKRFCDEQVYYLAYGKKTTRDTRWSTNSSVSGYTQLGYGKLHVIGCKMGNAIGRNYDNFYVYTSVGGTKNSNYYVVDYETTIGASNVVTFSPKTPESTSNKSISTGFSTAISSDGKYTNSVTVTASGNPDGQTFSFNDTDAYERVVTAKPYSVKRGQGWQMNSSAVISYKVNTKVAFGASISLLRIKNIAKYTLSGQENTILFLINNHKTY